MANAYRQRIAELAAAQSTGTNPRPDYALSIAAGSAPMPDAAHRTMVNAVQFDAEQQARIEEQQRVVTSFLGNTFSFLNRLATAKKKPGMGWDGDQSFWTNVGNNAGAVGRGIGNVFGAIADAADGPLGAANDAVNEGLGAITGMDAEVVSAGRSAMGTATTPTKAVEGVLDAAGVAYRGVSTLPNVTNIMQERGEGLWDLDEYFDSSLWSEAYERTKFESEGGPSVTLGRAFMDRGYFSPEERRHIFSEGFDEFGNPLDESYRKVRETDTWYNIGSGALDLTASFALDPLVVAGKASTGVRAAFKGDMARMAPATRRRWQNILTAPDSAVEKLKPKPYDVIGRRALKVRQEQDALRDRLRKGELNGADLMERVQAFEGDAMAAEAFRRGATIRHVGEEGFDDDAFRLTVGALLGDSVAMSALQQDRRFLDVVDALDSGADGARLRKLDDEIARTEALMADPQPALFGPSAYDRAIFDEGTLAEKRLQAEGLRAQLAEYHGYEQWYRGLLESVEKGTVRMAPRESASIGETFWRSFKPNHASTKSHTVVGTVKSAFLRRPGVFQHHDGNAAFTSVDRYFGELQLRGGNDALLDLAKRNGFEDFASFRRASLDDLMGRTLDTQRGDFGARVERQAIETLYRKWVPSADDEAVALFHDAFMQHRFRVFDDVNKANARPPEEGFKNVTVYHTADGDEVTTHVLPLSSTELANTSVLTDLQALDHFLSVHAEGISNLTRLYRTKKWEWGQKADAVFAAFSTYFKASVLFRLGWAIRSVGEGTMRALAVSDDVPRMMGSAARSAGNTAVRRGAKGINKVARKASFVNRHARRFIEERDGKLVPEIGEFAAKQRANVRGLDVEGLYEAGVADVLRSQVSSSKAHRRFGTMQMDTLRQLRAEHVKSPLVDRADAKFASAWKDRLENHIATDPIDRMMLEHLRDGIDDATSGEIVRKWLTGSAEGREMRRRLMPVSGNVLKFVQQRRARFDDMVPDGVVATRLLDEKIVDEEYLKKVLATRPDDAPRAIDAATDDVLQGKGFVAQKLREFTERWYERLGAMPEDVLVRHPFARQQYLASISRQADDYFAKYGQDALVPEDVLRNMSKIARNDAVKQARRYMFDTMDIDTGLTHTMRHLAPFMAAQYESLVKWARISMERPESFVRYWVNGWGGAEDLYGVEFVTEDGYTAEQEAELARKEGRPPKPADVVQTPLLGRSMRALDAIIPGNKLTEAADVFPIARFNKNNLNVITQGKYWMLPSFGPLVQFPLQAMYGDNPEWSTESGMKKFLWDYAIAPVGKQEAMDYIVPSSTLRKAFEWGQGEGSAEFKKLQLDAYRTLYARWQQEGADPAEEPTQAEASEIARTAMAFSILGRNVTPAAYQTVAGGELPNGYSPQFLIDNARYYQEMYGREEGTRKYMEDFGEDAYMWLTSTSGKDSTLPPTGRAWKGWKKFGDQIDEVPDLALAIVGMDADDDEFNMAVYQELIGKGGRYKLAPDEWRDKTEREQGWRAWKQWRTSLDEELAARGLASTRSTGAEDLALANYRKEQELKSMYPGWGKDKDAFDTGKSDRTLEAVRGLFARGDGDFLNRPDWEHGWKRYLELNDAFNQELDARKSLGGSADIDANSNADLLAAWHNVVGQLDQANPMFADARHRFLENHLPTGTYAIAPEKEQ